MSMVPHEENELIVQRTDLEPTDTRDSRSTWRKFIDALRTAIGLKPLYLAERWALAKVRQEEADADARLLAAKANYELAMAEARRLELEAEANYEKGMAEAEQRRLRSEIIRKATNPLVAELLDTANHDPIEALDRLAEVIKQIEMHGGTVELDIPPTDDSGPNSSS